MARKTTITPLKPALLVCSTDSAEQLRMDIADAAMLRVKHVHGLRSAMEVTPPFRPQIVLYEHGTISANGVRALRELAELCSGRRIPFVEFGSPGNHGNSVDGITVLPGDLHLAAIVEAIRHGLRQADFEREAVAAGA